MNNNPLIAQVCEKTETLVMRYHELHTTNQALIEQVKLLQKERDLLSSRLFAARARINYLVDHLPPATPISPTVPSSQEKL